MFLVSPEGSCGGRDLGGAGDRDLDTGSRPHSREPGLVGLGERREVGWGVSVFFPLIKILLRVLNGFGPCEWKVEGWHMYLRWEWCLTITINTLSGIYLGLISGCWNTESWSELSFPNLVSTSECSPFFPVMMITCHGQRKRPHKAQVK